MSNLPLPIAHATPNPNARKYVLPGVRFAQPRNVSTAAAAAADALTARLFTLEGVYNVFCAQDFVTINKRPDIGWEPLETEVLGILAEHINACADQRESPT